MSHKYQPETVVRKRTEPAVAAHVLLKEEFDLHHRATCTHPELVDAFLEWLATGKYREYVFVPNERYAILTDGGNWVEFKRNTTRSIPHERISKVFMALKSGFNYRAWGEFLDTLRPLMHLTTNPKYDAERTDYYSVISLVSGDSFELTSKPYRTTGGFKPVGTPDEVDYDLLEGASVSPMEDF